MQLPSVCEQTGFRASHRHTPRAGSRNLDAEVEQQIVLCAQQPSLLGCEEGASVSAEGMSWLGPC